MDQVALTIPGLGKFEIFGNATDMTGIVCIWDYMDNGLMLLPPSSLFISRSVHMGTEGNVSPESN